MVLALRNGLILRAFLTIAVFLNSSIYKCHPFFLLNCLILPLLRRGFRLLQRSHLRTLKSFVSEKSGKRCENRGNIGYNRETGKF